MAYCTTNDIIDAITEDNLIAVTDDDNVGEIDQAKVDKAIARADELINNHLRLKYTVPFAAPLPQLVNDLSTDLSIYFLYSRRLETKVPEGIEKRYDKAINQLQQLQKGEMVLDLVSGDQQSELRTNKSAADRVFDKDSLDKF